jgi:hypothetical protein
VKIEEREKIVKEKSNNKKQREGEKEFFELV